MLFAHRILPTFTQLKAEVSITSSTLEEAEASFAREKAARLQLDAEVSSLRVDRERDLRDLRAAHSEELTAAREDGMRRAEEAAAARAAEVRNEPRRGEGARRHGFVPGRYLQARMQFPCQCLRY